MRKNSVAPYLYRRSETAAATPFDKARACRVFAARSYRSRYVGVAAPDIHAQHGETYFMTLMAWAYAVFFRLALSIRGRRLGSIISTSLLSAAGDVGRRRHAHWRCFRRYHLLGTDMVARTSPVFDSLLSKISFLCVFARMAARRG